MGILHNSSKVVCTGCIQKMAEKFLPVWLALKARAAKAQGIALGLDILYYQP